MLDLPPPSHYEIVYFGDIVKIPNKKGVKAVSYAELPCSEEDKAKIIEIITTLGTCSKLSLLMNHKAHMEKIGDEVRHVHPLKFLGVIFSNAKTKYHMKEVLDDFFKSHNFLEGMNPCLNNEMAKDRINCYLPDFAKEINVPLDKIKHFTDRKDWTGLLRYITFET